MLNEIKMSTITVMNMVTLVCLNCSKHTCSSWLFSSLTKPNTVNFCGVVRVAPSGDGSQHPFNAGAFLPCRKPQHWIIWSAVDTSSLEELLVLSRGIHPWQHRAALQAIAPLGQWDLTPCVLPSSLSCIPSFMSVL